MAPENPKKWLVLIHQLPPKPDALRVKIWRRLQQIGAVAIKQSVYVMPYSEPSREDLSWTLKQIIDGGGEGSISEVRFVEGLNDQQIISLFQNARKSDYEKMIQEANHLLAAWGSGNIKPKDPAAKANTQVEKLQRQFESIAAIDFFETPERGTANLLIKDLAARWSGDETGAIASTEAMDELKAKVWVTRKNVFVDRIACGWLIRRFVDQAATFKYVDSDTHTRGPGEIRFDMYEGEYTHEGNHCTFEVMVRRLGIQDQGLNALAEVIHDIDLKDNRYDRGETNGLSALLTGLAASEPDDEKRMARGAQLMENLYAFYQRQKAN